jgi:hypothetical protein
MERRGDNFAECDGFSGELFCWGLANYKDISFTVE